MIIDLLYHHTFYISCSVLILGDPGADSGAEDENQNGREKFDE